MQVNIELYEALIEAQIPAERAKRVAESLNAEWERKLQDTVKNAELGHLATRDELKNLATSYQLDARNAEVRKDIAELETRLLRALSEMQRWTLTALFGGLGALAVVIKIWT